jgi:2,3-dihydroxybenzoate decarboxylase/5-carboxyvanillate decarboxylase
MAAIVRLIATEEAWSIPEVADELRKVANGPSQSLDKLLVKGIYDAPPTSPATASSRFLSAGCSDSRKRRLPADGRARRRHAPAWR